MTLADQNRRELTVHGPPVLTHYLASTRSFLRRDSIKVHVEEASLEACVENRANQAGNHDHIVYEDQHITVKALPLLPSGYSLPQARSTSPARTEERPSKRPKPSTGSTTYAPTQTSLRFLQLMFPNTQATESVEREEAVGVEMDPALRAKLTARVTASKQTVGPPPLPPTSLATPSTSATDQAPVLTYVVRGRPVRGKFDAAKAKAMGVPEGKLYGLLTNGKDVEVERPAAWATWDDTSKAAWLTKAKKGMTGKKVSKGAGQNAQPAEASESIEMEKVLVRSSELVAATQPGAAFVQVYIPSLAYLDSFLLPSVQSHLRFSDDEAHTMIHAVHSDVLCDERYRTFLQSFKNTHHVFTSRSFLPDRLAFPTSALSALRMSRLDKDMFQVAPYSLEPKRRLSSMGLEGLKTYLPALATSISLHPRSPPAQFDEALLDFSWPPDSEQADELVTFQKLHGRKVVTEDAKAAKEAAWKRYEDAAKQVSASDSTRNGHKSEEHVLRVTTLGTGSSHPSKYRNVSATLIHLPGKDAGYILLDAGESTYGQLRRKFGEQVDDVVANIRMIFLSHIHGDHHMGAARLLMERAKLAGSGPLFVVAPEFVRKYLAEMNSIQSLGIQEEGRPSGAIFIQCHSLNSRNGVVPDLVAHPDLKSMSEERSLDREEAVGPSEEAALRVGSTMKGASASRKWVLEQRAALTKALHGTQVYTTEVDHRASHCYGIVFRGPDWSGAYSGDTRPSPNLVQAGRGVDFLVHEATIEDSKPEMADMKGHSTFGQAIEVAKQMQVKCVILTHFSQRYPKLPRLDASKELGSLKVGIAFDLLTITLSDMDKLMRYREPLELLFDVDHEEEDGSEGGEDVVDEQSGPVHTKPVQSKKAHGKKAGDKAGKKAGNMKRSVDVAMDVDGARAAPVDGEQGQSTGRHGSLQRKLIKSHAFQYASFELRRVGVGSSVDGDAPSRLSIAKSLERSLVELNGLVNASFNWDLLLVEPREQDSVVNVLVKVDAR